MELVTEPDVYTPSIDENGNYVDKIPSFTLIKKGLICPCGSRKDKVYETKAMFLSHIKTKCHEKWLLIVNENKVNYYVENEKNKEIIQNQRLILAKLENDINIKILTIDYLTKQLNVNCKTVDNLIDIDYA